MYALQNYKSLTLAQEVILLFPIDESLLKMLYLVTQDVMLRYTGRIHNWGQILLQLSVYFPDRVKSFLC